MSVDTEQNAYLGALPSNRRLPSICSWTLTRSVGLAINCAMAPADKPHNTAFLQK